MPDTPHSLRHHRILVTGGAGFIGCALSHRLAPGAAAYVVLDNLHCQVHAKAERPSALHSSAELVIGDVTDAPTWDDIFGRFTPTLVIHLAAETGTGQSLTEASRHALVNVVGTSRLSDALGRHGIVPEHILLASSRAVYGEGTWRNESGVAVQPGQRSRAQLLRQEWDFPGLRYEPAACLTTPPAPTSVYGSTKLAQEHILSAWSAASGTALSILRFQNVFGPGQSLTNSYTGIVALFARLARRGESIPLYEDGAMTRDFVYIDDVADAIVAALQSPRGIRRYDVGTGVAASVGQMATLIATAYGAPPPHVSGKFRDGDVRHASCNIDPTRAALDWMPKWSLPQGLESLRKWIEMKLAETDGR